MRFNPLVFAGLLVLASCLDSKDYDIDKVTLTPTVALPLAFGNISILDLISDKDSSFLRVYPDGLLYFYYSQSLASQDIKGLFDLPNNVNNTSFDVPQGTLPPSSADVQLASVTKAIDLNLSPEQLTEILLKSGTLNSTISLTPANASLPFEVRVTLTDVVQKTSLQPLTFTAGNGVTTRQLRDYVIKCVSNRFNIKLDFILKSRTSSVFIANNTRANVQLSFTGMDFSYIRGFFGDQSATIPAQTIDLGVFNSSLNKSKVSFVQPLITMKVRSDYGMACEVSFSKLQASKPGATLPFQISPASPVNLAFPTTLGTSANTTVSVLNASDLLNFSPTKLEYAATARINKGVPAASNFLADTSKLRVTMTTEIPLYGKASGVLLIDTLKIDLNEVDESTVTTASMKIKSVNEMPLDAFIQLYMADQNYTILDSLFTANQTFLVKASTVTAAGELQTAGNSDVQINLDPQKLNKLFKSKYLLVRSVMNTTKDNTGASLNVKFKSSYKLKLNVGMLAKLNIKSE